MEKIHQFLSTHRSLNFKGHKLSDAHLIHVGDNYPQLFKMPGDLDENIGGAVKR